MFIGCADFLSAQFTENAWFESTQFKCGAAFSSAQFMGAADFNSTLCTGIMDFMFAQFKEYASFRSAQFTGDVYFHSAQFMKNAYFSSVQFTEDADFSFALFGGDVDFKSVMFSNRVSFQNAAFQWHAYFKKATFQSELRLYGTSFTVQGDFQDVHINGRVRLLWPGDGTRREQLRDTDIKRGKIQGIEIKRGRLLLKHIQFNKMGILDIRDNFLAPDSELVIDDCDMSRVLLEGTDCTKIHFYNCGWLATFVLGRQIVGDEWLARPYLKRRFYDRFKRGCRAMFHKRQSTLNAFRNWPKWKLIELTYQQLAKRYREDFNHPTANNFDCGTFEMRRLSGVQKAACKKKFVQLRRIQKQWFSLIAIYQYLSNYSASIWRPIIILASSLLVFAGWYRGSTYTSAHKNGLWGYSDYLGLSLQVSYLNRAGLEFARGNSIGVNIIMAFQVVLTATLVALFVFAVRRRFRHG